MIDVERLETYLLPSHHRVVWLDELAEELPNHRPHATMVNVSKIRGNRRHFRNVAGRIGATREGCRLISGEWSEEDREAVDRLFSTARSGLRRENQAKRRMEAEQQWANEPTEETQEDTVRQKKPEPTNEEEVVMEGEPIPPGAEHNAADDDDRPTGDPQPPVVYNKDQETLTTSLAVAKVYGKAHKNVLRAIEDILSETGSKLSPSFVFRESSYIDRKGEVRPKYEMNEDAFSLLVGGFTGAEAMRFKIAFITEFRRMRKALEDQAKQRTDNVITPAIVAAIAAAVSAAMQPFMVEFREHRRASSSGGRRPSDFGFEPPPQPVSTRKRGQTSLRPFVSEAKRWLKIRMPIQQILAFVEERLVAQQWAERGAPPNAYTRGNLLATPAGYESGYVVNFQASRPSDGVVFPMALNLTKEGSDYCLDILRAEFMTTDSDDRQSDFFRS